VFEVGEVGGGKGGDDWNVDCGGGGIDFGCGGVC